MQTSTRIFSLVLCASLNLPLTSCDAPRENPFDPDAANYQGPGGAVGALTGAVSNLASMRLSDAVVYTVPGNHGALTDGQGIYTIPDLTEGQYQVICTLSGFASDTLDVSIHATKTSTLNFKLDALPIIHSCDFTSHYIYNGPTTPTDYYTIQAYAVVSDADGSNDIAFVKLRRENGAQYDMRNDSIVGALQYYSHLLVEGDEFSTVDSVRFQHFWVQVTTDSGHTTTSMPTQIRYFFEDYPGEPQPDDPDTPQTILPIPLTWEFSLIPIDLTFTVEIHRIVFPQSLEWRQTLIPRTVNSAAVSYLTDGDYTWTVTCIDVYGNTARSKIAYLKVAIP